MPESAEARWSIKTRGRMRLPGVLWESAIAEIGVLYYDVDKPEQLG
jgi:hypothetical protein